jgi:lipopolysaccharide export system permease protein
LKRLNRYLITNAIKFLFITELVGIIMFVTIDFFEHMDIFTLSLSNFLVSILYLLLRAPYYINLILPLAFLISILILLILMIRGNEMIIVRTSGISTASLMKPLLAFSLVLVVLSFVLTEWIIPVTSSTSDYLYRVKIKGEEARVFFKNNSIWFKRNNVIYNIEFFDGKKDLIKGLTVLELSDTFSVKKRYDAKEGIYKDNAWYFTGVTERIFDEKGIVVRKTYEQFKDLLREPPSIFKVADRNPEDMGYKELSGYINRLQRDGHDINRYLVDLYDKIAFPFINLIMVFAAFSVGLRYMKTKHISIGIFSGILLGACYWVFHSISLSLGYSEIFPPLFAAWFSNLLFISSGVIGIVTLRT